MNLSIHIYSDLGDVLRMPVAKAGWGSARSVLICAIMILSSLPIRPSAVIPLRTRDKPLVPVGASGQENAKDRPLGPVRASGQESAKDKLQTGGIAPYG